MYTRSLNLNFVELHSSSDLRRCKMSGICRICSKCFYLHYTSIHNVYQINGEIEALKQEIHLLKERNTVLEAIASKVNRFEEQIGIFKSKNIEPFIKNVGVLQISCSIVN